MFLVLYIGQVKHNTNLVFNISSFVVSHVLFIIFAANSNIVNYLLIVLESLALSEGEGEGLTRWLVWMLIA